MRKLFGKTGKVLQIFLAIILTLPITVTIPVSAVDGPTVQNPALKVLDNGASLSKTVEAVEGYANRWKITLRIESPVIKTTSDTVLVIDRSGSMSGNKLSSAKSAAATLAQELLPEGNELNRIAVLSFGEDATTNVGFSYDYGVVRNAINGITAGGGTHTQAGMHKAAELISTSTADHKNIILLSDGEPTFSYGIDSPEDYLVKFSENSYGVGMYETSSDIPVTAFRYGSRVGNGSNIRTRFETGCLWTQLCYYNHGNSAISEAGFYKESGVGSLYTIALNVNDEGREVLRKMATPGKYYTASPSELEVIFKEIAGRLSSVIYSASVYDEMGDGVEAKVNTGHASSLSWSPKLEFDEKLEKYVAEYSYEITVNQEILEAENENGFYKANKRAVLTYNDGERAEFPVPRNKPYVVKVNKGLVGQECEECVFGFELTRPDNSKLYFETKPGEIYNIVEEFPYGKYSVVETATKNNPVKLNEYLTEYVGGDFVIDANRLEFHEVKIKNVYEAVDILATKKWNDAKDKDNLRKDYDLFVAVKEGGRYVDFAKIGTETEQIFRFESLPKNRDGQEIQYSIEEAENCDRTEDKIICETFDGDENYKVKIDGMTITNIHIPKTIEVNDGGFGGATVPLRPETGVKPNTKTSQKMDADVSSGENKGVARQESFGTLVIVSIGALVMVIMWGVSRRRT